MASKIIARHNQSMQDLVLMACGTMEAAMAFCLANGVRISDTPVVGRAYTIPDGITRNKEVLRSLGLAGVTIGTRYGEPLLPVSGWRVLLDPRHGIHVDTSGIGTWHVILTGTPAFVNYHPLQFDFDMPTNPVLYQSKTDYDVPNVPVVISSLYTPQVSKTIRWYHTTAMTGGAYLHWSNPEAAIMTSTWHDTDGNTAIYAPLMLTKDPDTCTHLIPQIDVMLQSVSDYEITLRVRWLHPPVSVDFPNFDTDGFEWLGAALDGVPVAGIPDCVDVSLPVGKHILGAVTHYTKPGASGYWPDSYKTIVVEVY